jgi:GNAT superfamily N-acetyltransferase
VEEPHRPAPEAQGPTTALDFVSATPGDAEAIRAVHAAVERHRGDALPQARAWTVPSMERVLRELRTCDTVLARDGGEVVASFRLDHAGGFAGVAPFTKARASTYLRDMAVVPAHYRRGVGRRCLQEAERRARARGSQVIRLDTNDDAFRGALFYAACGYREVMHYAQTFYFERLL